jgi:tetratricopeptide (TPR) repeat protein
MSTKGAVLLTLVLTAAACGPPEDQETGSLDPVEARQETEALPAALRARLDSGGAAFRAQDLDAALAHYTAATRIDESVAAAWFGVYMAQKAKGNTEEALAALERVQQLAPGASLVQPAAGDTAS